MAARHSPHTMNHDLLKAVATGDADLLAQILGVWSAATAEQDEEQSCLRGVTAEGSSALHIAASRGSLELVVMIHTHDSSLIKARNNQLDTPLICAARTGHADVVRYLIGRASAEQENGNPVLRAWNAAGVTAMHEAIKNGHCSVLRTLMLSDSILASVVDGKGVSPLYLAVVSDRADIMVGILIRESSDGVRSPASYLGPDGQTALHAAVYASKELCESLLCWEPALAEKVDNCGRTALHYAASAGKIGVVKLLLGNSSLAYIPDDDGLFPVHVAAISGKVKVICEFMKICPNCDELLDNKQRNILHCAIEHGRLRVVWHICRNRKFARMLNAVDSEGNTPLHLAIKHGQVTIFTLLMMDVTVNTGIINHDGLTAVDFAFIETFRDFSFSEVKNTCIRLCLLLCNSHPVGAWQNLRDKLCLENKEKESSIYTNVSQSILCISLLIAAGSFAAAFTAPGVYIAEGDDAVTFDYSVGAANCVSFLSSIIATCLLVHASITNSISMGTRRAYLLYVCSTGLLVSFEYDSDIYLCGGKNNGP